MSDNWSSFDFSDEPSVCPVCACKVAMPRGNIDAKILIIGEAPGEKELQLGEVMVGPMSNILKTELSFLHFSLKSKARMCNLWLHPPAKPTGRKAADRTAMQKQNAACLKFSLNNIVLPEAKGKEAILIMGSDAVEFFVGKKVMDINGLRVSSSYFPDKIVYAMVNPAIAFHSTIGEIRYALRNFVNALQEII